MDPVVYSLLGANVILGSMCAVPVARVLRRIKGDCVRFPRCYMALIGVYLAESVAMAMGMGIPVFSVALAFMWGAVFASQLKNCDSRREILRTTFFLSLYSSLPAMSFLVVPVACSIAGWDVLNSEAGVRFGIPEFLPWPSDTILGFYLILVTGAVILKTAITTWMVGSLFRRRDDLSRAS